MSKRPNGSVKKQKVVAPFRYKSLLLFSGICLAISLTFLCILSYVFDLSENDAFNALYLLVVGVPLVTQFYLWAKFFEWKNVGIIPYIFYFCAVAFTFAPFVLLIVWLSGRTFHYL